MISLKSMKIASGQASGGSATGLCQSTWSQGGGESFVFPSARGDCCSTFKLQASSFKLQRFNVSTFNVQQLARNGWANLVAAYSGPEGPRPEHNRGIEAARKECDSRCYDDVMIVILRRKYPHATLNTFVVVGYRVVDAGGRFNFLGYPSRATRA